MQNSDPLKSTDEILDLYNEIFENNTQAAPETLRCSFELSACSNLYDVTAAPVPGNIIYLTNFNYLEGGAIDWRYNVHSNWGRNPENSLISVIINGEEFTTQGGDFYTIGGGIPVNNEPCLCNHGVDVIPYISYDNWIENKTYSTCDGLTLEIPCGANVGMDFIKNIVHNQYYRGWFDYGGNKNVAKIDFYSSNMSYDCPSYPNHPIGWFGIAHATVSGIPNPPIITPPPCGSGIGTVNGHPTCKIISLNQCSVVNENGIQLYECDLNERGIKYAESLTVSGVYKYGFFASNLISENPNFGYLFNEIPADVQGLYCGDPGPIQNGMGNCEYVVAAWGGPLRSNAITISGLSYPLKVIDKNTFKCPYGISGCKDNNTPQITSAFLQLCNDNQGTCNSWSYYNNWSRKIRVTGTGELRLFSSDSKALVRKIYITNDPVITPTSTSTPTPTPSPTTAQAFSGVPYFIDILNYSYGVGDSTRIYQNSGENDGAIHFNLTGQNLYEPLIISCDENYNVSFNNLDYSGSLTVQPNQVESGVRIYLSFDPIQAVTSDKNILISSSDTTSQVVANGRAAAISLPRDFKIEPGYKEANISWTEVGNQGYIVVLASTNSLFPDFPRYLPVGSLKADKIYGQGSKFGSAYVVYKDQGKGSLGETTFKVTNLTGRQTYYFKLIVVKENQYTKLNGNINVNQNGSIIKTKPFSLLNNNIIAQWNFNSSDLNPSTGQGTIKVIGINTDYGLIGGSSTDPLGPNYNPNNKSLNYYGSSQSSANNSCGLEFSINTFNRRNIVIYWDNYFNKTCTRYLRAQYTLDITATNPIWIDYVAQTGDADAIEQGLYKTYSDGVWEHQRRANLSSISGANNNSKFGFRLVASYAPEQNGYRKVDSTDTNIYSYFRGNFRTDMFTAIGQIIDPNIVVPTPTPTSTPSPTSTPTPIYPVPTPSIHGQFYFSKINQKLWKSCKINCKRYYIKYFDIGARRFFNQNVPDKGWFFYFTDDLSQSPILVSFNLSNDSSLPFSGWVNINVTNSNTNISCVEEPICTPTPPPTLTPTTTPAPTPTPTPTPTPSPTPTPTPTPSPTPTPTPTPSPTPTPTPTPSPTPTPTSIIPLEFWISLESWCGFDQLWSVFYNGLFVKTIGGNPFGGEDPSFRESNISGPSPFEYYRYQFNVDSESGDKSGNLAINPGIPKLDAEACCDAPCECYYTYDEDGKHEHCPEGIFYYIGTALLVKCVNENKFPAYIQTAIAEVMNNQTTEYAVRIGEPIIWGGQNPLLRGPLNGLSANISLGCPSVTPTPTST
jgi:hypothetical protein